MPFDATGFAGPHRTDDELRDLAVLKQARSMLRNRRNWWQSGRILSFWFIFHKQHCALLAVSRAAADMKHPRWWTIMPRLYRLLPPQYVNDLPHFNDAPSTTHADVLALFDRAIAELEHV